MAKEQEEIKEEEKQINDFSSNPPLTQQEFDFISKDQPITEEKKRELTKRYLEQPLRQSLKEAEESMTGEDGVATLKPVKPLTKQEPSTTAKTEFPSTLPKHGIRGLYTDSEKILERAAQITNLPPESPFTQTIAQQLAKGDPFSSQAMEKAKEETMKLVRAGVIPNPYYEGFTGKITQAYETLAPLAVEIGLPMTQAIVTSPMLVAPVPGSRVAYFGGLGATSGVANLWAQQMRIGYGHQDETSYQEAAAATVWGMVPGLKTGKDMTKTANVLLRGVEGAVMAGGENATHQGLEILYGKKGEFSVGELGLTTAGGATIGGVLGRLESALVKYEPKEQAAPLLRKAIKDELAGAKKEVSRLRKQGQRKGLKVHEDKITKLEEQLNALREPEDKILQNTIDKLEEFEKQQVEAIELYAGEWKQSKAAEVLRESDVPPKRGDISALSPILSTDPDPILTGIKPEQSNKIREDVLLNKVFPRTQGTNQVTAREALQDVLEIAPDTSLSPVIKKLLALKEDTGIDVQIEEKSLASLSPQDLEGTPAEFPGAYIPAFGSENARIIIDGSVTYPLYTIVHESIHAATAPNINKFFDLNTFRTLKTDEERDLFLDGVIKDKNIPKDIKEIFSIFKKADSMREEVADKLEKDPNYLGNRYYWARDPHEFLTAVYSETALQNALKEVKYSPNMSMWDKIVDFVSKKIGLKGKANVNLVEQAISTIDNITKMKVPSIEGKAVQAAPTLENIQKDIDRARKFHGSEKGLKNF